MNFYDENGNGVITKKDLKALKKAGYLGDLTPAQAYKQLDANKDGIADPYEAARLLNGQGLSNSSTGTLPFGYSANPYGGFGMPTMAPTFGAGYPPPPGAFQNFGMGGLNGIPAAPPGMNGMNGLANYQAYPQDFLSGGFGGGAGGLPGGYNGFGY